MFKAKLSEVKACPSCGWIMRLQVDPDPQEKPTVKAADFSPVRFYLCANRACEHAERADRAA
jgi:hypothetical protein